MTEPPPVVRPVVGPLERRRPSRLLVALAGSLALCVAAFSVLSALSPGSCPAPSVDGTGTEKTGGMGAFSRFGPGTEDRVSALRDRLTAGLLSLGGEDGRFSPRPGDTTIDPLQDVEATGMAIAGLAAAKRLAAEPVRVLDAAIDHARAWLVPRQNERGGFGPARTLGGRAQPILAVAAATLGLALAGREADALFLEKAAGWLGHEAEVGPLPDGWTRGLATMAVLALIRTGHGEALGPDPWAAIQTKDVGAVRDARDQRVAEALARAIRARDRPLDPFVPQILAKVMADGFEWGGEQTDLSTWCLRAWLASRTPGGDAWFALTLPLLEKAPGETGVIGGEFYGSPVSRTAGALLILLEGKELRRPLGD